MHGRITTRYGLTEVHNLQGAINMQYDLSHEVQLYGFTVINHRDVCSRGFFVRWRSASAARRPRAIRGGADTAGNAWKLHTADTFSTNGPQDNETYGARCILDARLSYHRSRWSLTVKQ